MADSYRPRPGLTGAEEIALQIIEREVLSILRVLTRKAVEDVRAAKVDLGLQPDLLTGAYWGHSMMDVYRVGTWGFAPERMRKILEALVSEADPRVTRRITAPGRVRFMLADDVPRWSKTVEEMRATLVLDQAWKGDGVEQRRVWDEAVRAIEEAGPAAIQRALNLLHKDLAHLATFKGAKSL